MNRSIQSSWLMMILLVALVPLSIVSGVLVIQNYEVQRQQALVIQQAIGTRATVQLSDFVSRAVEEAQLLARQTSTIEFERTETDVHEQQAEVLLQSLFNRSLFEELAIIDTTGQEHIRASRVGIFPASRLRNRRNEAVVSNVLARNKIAYGTIYVGSLNNELLLTIGIPLTHVGTGKLNGVLVAELRLRQVVDDIVSITFGEQGRVALLASDGRLIAHLDEALVKQGVTLSTTAEDGFQIGFAGESVFASTTPLVFGEYTIYVVTQLPSNEALLPFYRNIAIALPIIVLTAIIAVVVGVIIVRRITRPVQQLALAAQSISRGEFTSPFVVTRRDEIGALQRDFNQMAQSLATQRDEIAERTNALREALATVEQRATEQANLLHEIEAQREMIRDLSVPVLPVSATTLVMPLIGSLDSARLLVIQEQALQSVQNTHTRYLLIDITGVPIVDTQVAQRLLMIIRMVRLLGAEVFLIGIRPEVAETIISLGIHLNEVRTFRDLQSGIARTLS